jgi:hypothetical protein
MQGPDDDVIESQLAGVESTSRAAEEEPPPPPEGGKPLLRLLQLVGSAGYAEAVTASVDVAVVEDDREDLRARLSEYISLPPAAENGGGKRSRAKSRSKRSSKSTAPRDTAAAAEDVAQAYMDAADELGPPTATGPQWRSLGPWTIPNGQTYGASRVNVAGRISSIAMDPSNAAHILVGAANGGVWESRDRGASWAPRTDYAATLAIGAIAFDRTNPRNVYCGLGEGDWWWWLGAGMLRSSDGGASWSTLCTAPFVGQGFYALVVDPANGRHLLAGTTGGLYVSTNGGVSWTRRRAVRTWSIAISPAGGAGAEILAACSDGIWRSTNGGTSWTAVTLPRSPGTFTRLAVAIAPSNRTIAYAWGAGPPNTASGPTPYLWRRASGTWRVQGTPPGVATGQAWYDWFLGVSPDRANQIYLGAISVHRGDLATVWTWRDIASRPTGDSIHPDQHAIAFEPGRPDTIYVGNDGGLYMSPNRGTNWQHRNNGLVITEFEYLAQHHGSARWLIGGTQDNGTERWLGSPTWEHVADGDGGDCGVNRANPTTVFHTFYGMSPQRSTAGGSWGTWASVYPPVPVGEGGPFYPPFECSATNGDTIAIGGNALYVSRNSGTAWTRLAYPSGGTASGLGVPNADTVYVGLGDGRILRTTWTGAAWSALTALTTPRAGAAVSDIEVDSANPLRIWVTYFTVGGGRVYRSDNGGTNWTDRTTAGLPNLSINAIALDPWNGNRAWVAASLGVYQTTDGGASWTGFAASLPNAYVGDLLFHPHARVLRAGLRNRGAWEIPVDGWMTQPLCGRQFVGNLAANQSQRWFTFNWPATWHVVWTVMPTTPRPGAPQIRWDVQVERASHEFVTYWITAQNLTAAPVDFEGRYCILSRY